MEMQKRYYLDTSIWLDFLEGRDEPDFPKSSLAKELVNKIIKEGNKIIYSDLILIELRKIGYSKYDLEYMFAPLRKNLVFMEATPKQVGKGRDLSFKRNVPKADAIHALIARDNNAILVTLDKHFQKLIEIIKPFKPQELL